MIFSNWFIKVLCFLNSGSLMIVVADELIEFIYIRFGSFHIEVLGSKVLSEGSSKEGVWDS